MTMISRARLLHLRTIGGVEQKQGLVRGHALSKIRIGRVVAESVVLDQVPEHINAESIDASPEPKPHGAEWTRGRASRRQQGQVLQRAEPDYLIAFSWHAGALFRLSQHAEDLGESFL
jgi:hypothetical protein